MKYASEAEYIVEKRVVLVSDVHLTPNRSRREQAVQRFFLSTLPGAQRLFILGDLFDFWIGDKHARGGKFGRAMDMLKGVVAAGVPITILRGNRDFYMGREITEAIGAEVLSEGVTLNAGGRRIYICHGDAFCTRDVSYLRTRAILRSRAIAKTYSLLPASLAHFLAEGFRQMSGRGVANKKDGQTSIVLNAVETLFDQGYDAVICGHVHTPRHARLLRDDGEKTIVVLGNWSQYGGWYAEVDTERLELLRFR